ncbi:triple tyrosine motif-containing protein [uncultured Polaribacter sp.]|uniref:helix-turn-helix and ligand-binding sensor domain-containing protein n=1 Tax=uncultured Polaribacter sp. TaxID=174711 RepID=UPI002621E3DB|nr:triple tyrosine motif-containing protein [uncultured Polaribacter sp.]
MEKYISRNIVVVILLFVAGVLRSQEVPPIDVYTTEQYGGENQNWSISQSENKYIYVANNKGLLEFNGEDWQLYVTPNETIMRSVKCISNRIYTGFFMDFGYWEKDEFGLLKYSSLVNIEKVKMLEDEQIWEIIELDGWVLFKSLQRIYLYNLNSRNVKIIESFNSITKIAKVNNVVYFQDIEKGLFKIENGASLLVSDDAVFKKNKLINIFYLNDKPLFLTQKKGFYFFENNKVVKWNINADEVLKYNTIYSAEILVDDSLVLGTISNGLIYINKLGEIEYELNQNLGLSNNTVLSIFQDFEKNLWLGLDNGINLVNFNSPFKTFSNQKEYLGTIYTTLLFEGNMYLGTNQGLFVKKYNTTDPFKFVNKTQGQVWSLKAINGTLFCGHDTGTFIINNKKANLIFDSQGSWDFKAISGNLIIQGSYDGLYVLQKNNNNWVLRNKINGFDNSSRYFLILDNSKIFVNHEYKGVFKLKIDSDLKNVEQVEKEMSVNKGLHSSLIKYNNDVLYASKEGVFKYNSVEDIFKIDSVYSNLLPKKNFVSAKLITDKRTNKLWAFTNEGLRYLSPGALSNKPNLNIIPIKNNLLKGASGFENIIHLENDKYLVGTINGYLIVDLSKIEVPKNFNISITKVINYETDKPIKNIKLTKEVIFKTKENSVEFSYSVPSFVSSANITYQHKLEGYNSKWSDYSESNTTLFENLPHGNYTFKVRALMSGKISSNIASFNFNIAKPWYLSEFAILVYVLIFILLVLIWYMLSKKYYNDKQQKLLMKAQREIELKELESSQKIIKLNNEKLRNDIASKNRELATSTMSIIKKNEFLSNLKTELLKGDEQNIKKVVKIIDNNLNNTDDWKMFQEAFNNADQSFLDKMKEKHDNLTPNDLRLCAYLRLNLSSKEIAPLLNISPRSVEVKRYRLRKKMNLEHDMNLTNYILNI